jgi:GT2 family glycosyltransferase
MTSSERHISTEQSRWDFNAQCYKDNRDVFCENDLFSIIVLSHGRPDTTRRSILSTLDCARHFDGEIEWVFIENGGSEANYEFFQGLDLERKVVVRHRNYGINHGLNQGWGLSRGEFCMIHENDWEATREINYFKYAKEIFNEYADVGIIQLRDPLDPHENHGSGKPMHNPWSCREDVLQRANIKVWKEQTKSGHSFLISEFPNGFNNNPVIIRKSVYRSCGAYPEPEVGSDPRHGETEYQARVAELGCAIAYIGAPIYWHMGRVQTQAQ